MYRERERERERWHIYIYMIFAPRCWLFIHRLRWGPREKEKGGVKRGERDSSCSLQQKWIWNVIHPLVVPPFSFSQGPFGAGLTIALSNAVLGESPWWAVTFIPMPMPKTVYITNVWVEVVRADRISRELRLWELTVHPPRCIIMYVYIYIYMVCIYIYIYIYIYDNYNYTYNNNKRCASCSSRSTSPSRGPGRRGRP